MSRSWLAALALGLLVLVAFGRTLGNGFAYDDHPVLVENPAVHGGTSVGAVLTDPATHGVGDVVRAYRPLRTLVFMGEHRIFGGSPAPYHAVNLLLHALVVLLAWRLAGRVLPPGAALAAAAIFAVHPLQAEVVASIKAQDDLIAALILLATTLAFLSPARTGAGRWWLIAPFVLGLLAKESVLILPALLAALWLLNLTDRPRMHAPWALLAVMAAVGGLFLVWRSHLLASAEGAPAPGPGRLFPDSLAWVPLHARLFLWPHPLSIDHTDLAAAGFGTARFWISLALQAAVTALLWRTRSRAARFGLVWFYVTLVPSLNLVTSYFVYAERFAYLPLLGLAVLTAGGAGALGHRLGMTRPAWAWAAMALLPIAVLAAVSVRRCGDWKDSETLFRAALRVNPDATVVRHFLISELLRAEKTDEARALLARSRVDDLRPVSAGERAEIAALGVVALQERDYARAAAILRRVVESPYVKAQDWFNLGTALTNLEDYEPARDAFRRSLSLDPDDAGAHRMLGRIELETEHPAEAVRAFADACRLDPGHSAGWYYSVVATRQASGDSAAAARLDEATARGIGLTALFAADSTRWREVAPSLRRAMARNGSARED